MCRQDGRADLIKCVLTTTHRQQLPARLTFWHLPLPWSLNFPISLNIAHPRSWSLNFTLQSLNLFCPPTQGVPSPLFLGADEIESQIDKLKFNIDLCHWENFLQKPLLKQWSSKWKRFNFSQKCSQKGGYPPSPLPQLIHDCWCKATLHCTLLMNCNAGRGNRLARKRERGRVKACLGVTKCPPHRMHPTPQLNFEPILCLSCLLANCNFSPPTIAQSIKQCIQNLACIEQ